MNKGGAPLHNRNRRKPVRNSSPLLREFLSFVEEDGLTGMEFADATGLAHNTLSLWRMGEGGPSVRGLERACKALGYEMKLVKKEARSALSEGQ